MEVARYFETPLGRSLAESYAALQERFAGEIEGSKAALKAKLHELEEGPRMTARIAECAFEDLRVGLPVEVDFEDVDDVTLVRFRPRAQR